MKIIFEFKINCLPIDLTNLFHENKDISSQVTCNVSKGRMFVPQIYTKSFGSNSLKYSAAVLWNNHLKIDEKINSFTKIGPVKNYFLLIFIFHPIMRNKLIFSLHYYVYYYLIMLLLLILLLSLV